MTSGDGCGVGKYRPACMRRFGTVGWFTFFASLFSFSFGLFPLYTVSQITTIEKLYDLSSQRSGVIVSCSEMGFIFFAILVGYCLNHAHRPRILIYCAIAITSGALIATVPLYMDLAEGRVITPGQKYGFNNTCTADVERNCEKDIEKSGIRSAFWVFLLAMFICGLGSCGMWTIGVSYIDDNADKKRSYFLINLTFCARFLSPVGGMLLGAAIAPIPVHIKYTGGSPDDDDWVGAWWLGYYVIFTSVFVTAIPIWFYPKALAKRTHPTRRSSDVFTIASTVSDLSESSSYPNQNVHCVYPTSSSLNPSSNGGPDDTDPPTRPPDQVLTATSQSANSSVSNGLGNEVQESEAGSTKEISTLEVAKLLLKGFPRAVLRVIKNPIFVCICFVISVDYGSSVGFATFLPKYLELYFHTTASTANLVTGISLALAVGIGCIAGGYLMSAVKMKLNKMLCIAFVVYVFTSLMFIPLSLINCDGIRMAGVTESMDAGLNMTCNSNCSCHTSMYSPVCDERLAYYSPCHAGCTTRLGNNTYTDCSCAAQLNDVFVSGLCEKECTVELWSYTAVLFVSVTCLTASVTPAFMLTLRCVDENDKALALVLLNICVSLCGFPAPVIYGSLIDGVCLVVNQLLCEEGAACMFYDSKMFKYRLHFFTLGLRIIPTIFYFACCYLSRKTFFRGDENVNTEKRAETLDSTRL